MTRESVIAAAFEKTVENVKKFRLGEGGVIFE